MYNPVQFWAGQAVSEDFYKIGMVAKRTGISPECLRAWERRYGLQPADRVGRTRFYSASQLRRLEAIKVLLDQGHPISQVIHIADAELERRLGRRSSHAVPKHDGRIGLIGGGLLRAYREATNVKLNVIAEWATVGAMDAERGGLPELDCLVVYLPTLDPQTVEIVEEAYPSARIAVVFKYTTAADFECFRSSQHPLLRWPAQWRDVEQLVITGWPRSPTAEYHFSEDELVHIDQVASQAACECPRHLVGLINELSDYMAHADRCGGDEDHAAIRDDVRTARTQLERSLRILVDKYGLLATVD